MAAHEVKNERWGSNLSTQIVAHVWKDKGNKGKYNITTEEYAGLFGRVRTRKKKEYVGTGWVPTTDDNEQAKRQYQHRCGLLKIAMTPHRDGHMFLVFLDGHVISRAVPSEMEFH